MWVLEQTGVAGGQQYRVLQSGDALSFDALFKLWIADDSFCQWYSQALAASPFSAAYWEFPALTRESVQQVAQFVLLDAPELAATDADPTPFDEHFREAAALDVARFENLGGDALLVAPCPRAEPGAYTHLLKFLRAGPADQRIRTWQAVSRALQQRLSDQPLWLSTAGMGVFWLHFRLDDRPKYYRHQPYRHR